MKSPRYKILFSVRVPYFASIFIKSICSARRSRRDSRSHAELLRRWACKDRGAERHVAFAGMEPTSVAFWGFSWRGPLNDSAFAQASWTLARRSCVRAKNLNARSSQRETFRFSPILRPIFSYYPRSTLNTLRSLQIRPHLKLIVIFDLDSFFIFLTMYFIIYFFTNIF